MVFHVVDEQDAARLDVVDGPADVEIGGAADIQNQFAQVVEVGSFLLDIGMHVSLDGIPAVQDADVGWGGSRFSHKVPRNQRLGVRFSIAKEFPPVKKGI